MMATVLPLAVIAWAILRPRKGLLIAALLLESVVLESVLLVIAGWHILAAVVRGGGYGPGVITAVLINLPFEPYALQRALKEKWVGARTACLLLVVALLLHIVALGSLPAG